MKMWNTLYNRFDLQQTYFVLYEKINVQIIHYLHIYYKCHIDINM